MELTQDWRKLQSTFHPSSFAPRGAAAPSATGTISCIRENDVVVQLFAEGEDLSDWIGASVAELRAQFPNRVIVELDRSALESNLLTSLGEPHLEAQIGQWRALASEQAVLSASGRSRVAAGSRKDQELLERHLVSRRHFLLEALRDSWWTRVLPSSFGIFLRFEGAGDAAQGARDYLLVYRKGKLEQFGAPDLGFLSADRRRDPADVVKYLSERCMVPVQGVLLREEDWARWSEEPSPWREIAWAVQSNRVQLVPFRWSIVALLAIK